MPYSFGQGSINESGGNTYTAGTGTGGFNRNAKGAIPYRHRAQQLYDATKDWKERWMEVKDYSSPHRGRFLQSSTEQAYRGTPEDLEILNNIAVLSSRVLSSGIMSGLTSPNTPWFALTLPDVDYRNAESVSRWLEEVRDYLQSVMAHSNFYLSMENLYAEVVDFGIGAMLIEEDDNDIIRCIPLSIGEFQIATDPRGKPNTLYRRFYLTADQIVQQFGRDNLPKTLDTMYESQNDTKYLIIHAIEPRGTRDLDQTLPDDMMYVSAYFMYDQYDSDTDFLRFSGYRTQPFVAPRWGVVANEAYGISPGMNALNDVRMAQRETELFLEGYEKATNPAVNVPPTLGTSGADVNPGAINTVAGGGENITPIYAPTVDYNGHLALMQDTESKIKETYYVPLFSAFLDSTKRMTAQEAAALQAEKRTQIGPVLERLQVEALEPVIDRMLDIMDARGMLINIPDVIQSTPIDLEYNGLLAQAQRAADTAPVEQWLAFLGNASPVLPGIMDYVNADEVATFYAQRIGVPPSLVRTDDEVAQLRQAQAEQAQTQQQMEAMATVAKPTAEAAKILSETTVGAGGESVLDRLVPTV